MRARIRSVRAHVSTFRCAPLIYGRFVRTGGTQTSTEFRCDRCARAQNTLVRPKNARSATADRDDGDVLERANRARRSAPDDKRSQRTRRTPRQKTVDVYSPANFVFIIEAMCAIFSRARLYTHAQTRSHTHASNLEIKFKYKRMRATCMACDRTFARRSHIKSNLNKNHYAYALAEPRRISSGDENPCVRVCICSFFFFICSANFDRYKIGLRCLIAFFVSRSLDCILIRDQTSPV